MMKLLPAIKALVCDPHYTPCTTTNLLVPLILSFGIENGCTVSTDGGFD
jgi:hypothetical protein